LAKGAFSRRAPFHLVKLKAPTYIDKESWLEIGKRLEDYTEEDMKKLSFISLAVCEEFYFVYSKIKGFGGPEERRTQK